MSTVVNSNIILQLLQHAADACAVWANLLPVSWLLLNTPLMSRSRLSSHVWCTIDMEVAPATGGARGYNTPLGGANGYNTN